jgi:hypothetical protein
MYVCTYVPLSVRPSVYLSVCMYYVYMYVLCMYFWENVYMYIYTYISIYIHIYIYIYINISKFPGKFFGAISVSQLGM